MKKYLFSFLTCALTVPALAQDSVNYHLLHFTSTHTSFPDTGRANGHMYDSVLYTNAVHYTDSTVLAVIPHNLVTGQPVDLIFWFHGWRNNIDTAAVFYGLIRQFMASKRNAILVLSETAKNAPDSYGGKLEQPGMFRALVWDLTNELRKKGFLTSKAEPAHIILAGHSGAFRVIAYILQNGQVPVQEVFLFDALYGEVPKFQQWISLDQRNHFIHWFTNQGGGTDEVSVQMMEELKQRHEPFLLTEELTLTPAMIRNNRILFVHSTREHNVIIHHPDDFQILLENSFVLSPLK